MEVGVFTPLETMGEEKLEAEYSYFRRRVLFFSVLCFSKAEFRKVFF